jgi:hypothetical protein
MRHDPGLAASPRVRYRLKVARSEISLPFLLPSAQDGQQMSAHPRLKSHLRRVKALSRWNAAAGSGRWPLPERRCPYQIAATWPCRADRRG